MSSAFVVIAVAIGFVCTYMGKTKSEFSYLLMQNVEALADKEYSGWLWKKEWVACKFDAQIILDSSCGGLSAGVQYKLTAEVEAELENCSVTITYIGGSDGEKSYCRDGWTPWCAKDECR